MRTETKTIFYSDDGKIHNNEASALAADKQFENDQKRTSYWKVVSNPDLAEGRGWYSVIHLKVYIESPSFPDLEVYARPFPDHEVYVRQWCFETYGALIAFVQGCSPIVNWHLFPSNFYTFEKNQGSCVGDYKYAGKQVSLSIAADTHLLRAVVENQSN